MPAISTGRLQWIFYHVVGVIGSYFLLTETKREG
jgi:hypothetical protein